MRLIGLTVSSLTFVKQTLENVIFRILIGKAVLARWPFHQSLHMTLDDQPTYPH